jgi:hypothetical protein
MIPAVFGEFPIHASMELTARPDLVFLYARDRLDKDSGWQGRGFS